MKKKGKKKFSRRTKNFRKKIKIKKRKKLRKTKKRILKKHKRKIKKTKKKNLKRQKGRTRRTKKRSLKRQKRKSRKIKINTPRIKLEKIILPNFNKQINQLKKLSFRKIMGFIFKPLIKSYGDYRQKKKIEKLKKI